LSFMALILKFILFAAIDPFPAADRVNPRGSPGIDSVLPDEKSPLMTGRCYCSGSEEEDSLFRWR
jgi:hypothetical protein